MNPSSAGFKSYHLYRFLMTSIYIFARLGKHCSGLITLLIMYTFFLLSYIILINIRNNPVLVTYPHHKQYNGKRRMQSVQGKARQYAIATYFHLLYDNKRTWNVNRYVFCQQQGLYLQTLSVMWHSETIEGRRGCMRCNSHLQVHMYFLFVFKKVEIC